MDNEDADIELLPVHRSHSSRASPASPGSKSSREDVYKNENGSLLAVDKPAFYLLVMLYFLQGIPVGLAFGSIPFLMKASHLNYSQLGTFSLASYPYSLKLFWSPFVDSFYNPKVGRRRSWIIPIQSLTGIIFIILGLQIDTIFRDLEKNLNKLTFFFFLLVLMASTQDIAVDSWALVILSPGSKSYASTAQTVGLNTGYFLSFTVFLAFNSKEFMNKYFRSAENQKDVGLVTLGQYMVLSGLLFLLLTAYVAWRVPEVPQHLRTNVKKNDELSIEELEEELQSTYTTSRNGWTSLQSTYLKMYRVLSLPIVQQFIVILLVCKIGFLINEGATNLKLLEKGFSKEDLSLTVLIDFPFEIFFGYYVAKYSRGENALQPWLYGYVGRLIAALFAQLCVYMFPTTRNSDGIETNVVTPWYFFAVIIQHLFSNLMGTIQFVSLAAFHTKIADPTIGGTYMTTLNTLSNFGGTWPKFFLFKFIDKVTYSVCTPTSFNKHNSVVGADTFWTNVLNFVNLAKGQSDLSSYFKTEPKDEELKKFVNFDTTKFSVTEFIGYASKYFGFASVPSSLKDLSSLDDSKIDSYRTMARASKVKFWENFSGLSTLPQCPTEQTKQVCLNYFEGTCTSIKDGYYVMNMMCVTLGTLLLVLYIWRKVSYLQSLNESHWRVK